MGDLYRGRFDAHELHGQLERCEEELSRWDSSPLDGTDDHLSRVRVIVDSVRATLAAQDPRLVTLSALDALKTHAEATANALSTFNAQRSEAAAEAAANAAGDLLEQLIRRVPTIIDVGVTVDAEAVLASVRREAETLISRATEAAAAVQAAEASLAEARDAVTQQLGETEAAAISTVRSTQQAVDEAIASARSEFEAGTKAVREELTSTESGFKKRTEELDQQRGSYVKQISEALAGIETRYDAAEVKRIEDARKQFDSHREQHDELIEAIRKTGEQAEEVLVLAGGAALAGDWKKQANRQFWERVIWSGVAATITIFAILVGWSLRPLTAPPDYSFVQALIFYAPRLPLAVVTITALGFAINQSGKHGQWEARDRRVYNEMTALPSFLAQLPEGEERAALAMSVAQKYFPGPELVHDVGQPEPKGVLSEIPWPLVATLSGNVALAFALVYTLTR